MEAVTAPAEATALDSPELFVNRELSWLQFNERVLELAEDESTPLLERVKFLAIYASNLDEFFMVRVAGLHDQVDAGIDARGPDGLSARQTLEAIRETEAELAKRHSGAWEEEARPALAEHGIRVVDAFDCTEEEQQAIDRLFAEQIFPVLTPLAVGPGRPFPYISNLSLSIGVFVRDPESDLETFARVKVPKEMLARFVPTSDGRTFVLLEDLIAAHLHTLFPGMEIVDVGVFRVTRDADFTVSDEADDLLQAVEDELRRRRFGEVVRVETSAGMSAAMREQITEALEAEPEDLFDVPGLLDLNDLVDIVKVHGFPELRDPPWTPVTQPRLQGDDGDPADVLGAMRRGDLLVHHPYDSFATSVERFVEQAV
ncbi:MAG: polyphosphate kinase, partial [Thermoleophilaceae bacterium]|nr:polyphosphate kinase [Thermoleophilaceae bacterium]